MKEKFKNNQKPHTFNFPRLIYKWKFQNQFHSIESKYSALNTILIF